MQQRKRVSNPLNTYRIPRLISVHDLEVLPVGLRVRASYAHVLQGRPGWVFFGPFYVLRNFRHKPIVFQ